MKFNIKVNNLIKTNYIISKAKNYYKPTFFLQDIIKIHFYFKRILIEKND